MNLSLLVSIIAAGFTGGTLLTQRQALHANQQVAADTQRATLFSQFQQQYNNVAAQFPTGYAEPTFRPAAGSDSYARLQAYWFFCFSEWYATHRVNAQVFGPLWNSYYAPLIADGLKVKSLRYVLEDRVRSRGIGGGDWTAFLRDIAQVATAHSEPLSPDVQARINGAEVAIAEPTDVRFASKITVHKEPRLRGDQRR